MVISGEVTHCSDGEPFSGVKVSVTENGKEIVSTTTKADGTYTITLPFTEKLLQVTASSPGHNPVTNDLTLADNSLSVVINFVLGMDEVWISDTTGDDDTGLGTETSPYKTLRKGIKETNAGGTLHVLDGIYTGNKNRNLEIKKSISIIGQSQENTIINAKGKDWIFDVHNTGLTVLFSKLTLKNAYIDWDDGAAIWSEGSTVTVSQCSFIDNYADDGYDGGAIYNNGGALTVINCLFKGNYADRHGGAIFNINADLTVKDSTFKKNEAGRDGGAISNEDGELTITGSTFKKNQGRYGGAIYNEEADLNIKDSEFIKNKAREGGAICLDDADAVIKNTDFTKNKATNYRGGAIYNDDSLECTDCNFSGNSAEEGGAIYNTGSTTTKKCDFTENVAADGGAIYNNDELTCKYCNFNSNTADGDGGAIYNGGTATVIGTNLVSNTATNGNGGAFYNYEGDFKLNFNRIIGNKAGDQGQDIYDGNTDTEDEHDALYNWWGSNDGPGVGRIAGDLVEYDPWLVMRYSAKPLVIPQGSKSTLIADFRYDSDGNFHDPSLGHIPDGLPVTFTTNLGNVGSKSVVKYTINGVATAILRGDEGVGYALTSVSLDSETLYRTVQITPAVNAADTKTVGMQTTGAPILPLLLAALLLVSGIFVSRKK